MNETTEIKYRILANTDLQGNDLENVFKIVSTPGKFLTLKSDKGTDIFLKKETEDKKIVNISGSEISNQPDAILSIASAEKDNVNLSAHNITFHSKTQNNIISPNIYISDVGENESPSNFINVKKSNEKKTIDIKSDVLTLEGDAESSISIGDMGTHTVNHPDSNNINFNGVKIYKTDEPDTPYIVESSRLHAHKSLTIHDLEISWDDKTNSVLFKGK